MHPDEPFNQQPAYQPYPPETDAPTTPRPSNLFPPHQSAVMPNPGQPNPSNLHQMTPNQGSPAYGLTPYIVDSAQSAYPPPFAAPVASPHPSNNWRAAFFGMVLLLVLAVGIIAGTLFSRGRTAATTATPKTTSSNTAITLPTTVQDLQQTIIATVKLVQPSVVEVHSVGRSGSAIGSGEFLTADGYILTNDHVVTGFTSYSVTLSDGTNHAATLVGEASQDDLAVLKTDVTNATPITFADSSQAQIGQFVLAIGSPLGLEQSASFGIVSAVNRTEQEPASSSSVFGASAGGPILTGLIQTSAPINPGNSGGALVDLQGRLLGITTLGASGTQSGQTINGIGFAINSNRAKAIADQLIATGHVTSTGQGFLGIQGQDVTAADGLAVNQGVVIRGFANDAAGNSPAQKAGLQTGDIIVAINTTTIASSTDIARTITSVAPNTTVKVTVQRGTSQTTVNVTLGERPKA